MSSSDTGRLALYPGTFDPVTNGHMSLIDRAIRLFDKVVVAIARNAGKQPFFTYEERVELMEGAVDEAGFNGKVKIIGFTGLLADLAKEYNAAAIVRGLRAVSDFEYEFQMALMNRKLAREAETVFLMPSLSWVYLSSTIVRDVARHGGQIDDLVPANVERALKSKLATNPEA